MTDASRPGGGRQRPRGGAAGLSRRYNRIVGDHRSGAKQECCELGDRDRRTIGVTDGCDPAILTLDSRAFEVETRPAVDEAREDPRTERPARSSHARDREQPKSEGTTLPDPAPEQTAQVVGV